MRNTQSIFTRAELTERKIDNSFILKQAKDVLEQEHGVNSVCMNNAPKYPGPWTVAHASEFIEAMIEDTLYYARA